MANQPPTVSLAFSDLLLIDAIRRENHCNKAICAYEADCICWREFVSEKEKTMLVSHKEMLEIITNQIIEAARKSWETKTTVVCEFELYGCKVSVTPLASSQSD